MSSSRFRFAPGLVAGGIVVAGVAVGAAAYFGGKGVSAQNAMPGPSLEWVPAGATLVGYVDLESMASSPLADPLKEDLEAIRERGHLGALEEIEESTSIDILNDVDSLTLAVGPGAGQPERWGIAIQGAFDRERLLEKLSGGRAVVETSTHSGIEIHRIQHGSQPTAMAQPVDSILLFGEPAYVREMVDAGSGRKPSAAGNLAGFRFGDFQSETFWVAGEPPDFVHGLVGRGSDKASLRSFAVTGRLDTDVVLRARGEAVDAKTAQELADVVRGLVALGRLRDDADNGSPESEAFGKILESISVDLVDDEIDVSVLVPYDSIRQLLERKRKEPTAH